jgi:hypothetical protein
LISLDQDDRAWLEAASAREGKPATELIRRAVKLLRAQTPPGAQPLADLLRQTRGLWREGDGLAFQERLRGEW